MTRAAVSYSTNQPLKAVEVWVEEDVREHDVLVRFMAAGLCHTDLSIINGALPVPLPIIHGHEGASIVRRLGRRALA